MTQQNTPVFSTRRSLLVAGATALAAPLVLRAQSPAKVIRIGSPDLGTAGKPSPGGSVFAVLQANKWLEDEFAKDGIKIEWNFFRGAGPAVHEALSAKQLDIVSLGDLAAVIGRARGLPTRFIAATGRGSNSYLATAPGVSIKTVADLKGKKLTVLKGTAYQRTFDNLLAAAGLTEKDVKLINMDWPTSKAAVVHMTKSLALEWARYGIRVNAIEPGYIGTEMTDAMWETDYGKALINRIPMRRLGKPEELDGALLLLATDAGSWMTGAVIAVDGGHLCSAL